MKYLIVVFVVVIAVWLMLRDRDRVRGPSRASRASRGRRGPAPAEMVQCLHCGIHLPRSEAVEDKRGAFCTEAHRLAGPR